MKTTPGLFSPLTLGALFTLAVPRFQAQQVIHIGPGGESGFEETSSDSIQRAIDRLARTGGTIMLASGQYSIRRTITIRAGKELTLQGATGARLVLDIAPASSLATPAAAGDFRIRLADSTGFAPGHEIELLRDSPRVPLSGRIARVDADGTVTLAKALTDFAAAGTPVMTTENVIGILDEADNVTLSNLEIDLQRNLQPFAPINHTRHCGIFVAGNYNYARGASTYCRRVRILDCRISNAHHRGIAMYATTDSEISRCRIENTTAEAIDIDHYCQRIAVTGNVMSNGQMSGIEINDGSDNLIARNIIDGYPVGINCWWYPPCLMPEANQRNIITENTIRNSLKNAISFQRNTERNSITKNTIEGVARSYGILMMGDRSLIEDNRIGGAPHGDIRDGGTGNVVVPSAGK
jgi:hypothetical protein